MPRRRSNLTVILTEAIDHLDMTKAEFAQRLGLSSAALSRILHARGVLNVERSLKVASLYDIDAAVVLRAAGHHKIVDLLEEVYTPQRIRSIKMSPEVQRQFIQTFESLSHSGQILFNKMLAYMVERQGAPPLKLDHTSPRASHSRRRAAQ
jgi:transcriptional regulator with XRE-family HTH domain